MPLLMIDNEIRHHRARLLNIKKRLIIELEDDRQVLDNQINKNRRDLILQQAKVKDAKDNQHKLLLDYEDAAVMYKKTLAEIKTRKDNMRNTRVIIPASRLLNPVGPSRTRTVIIGIFIGFFFAIIVVFIKEFIKKLRKIEKQMA